MNEIRSSIQDALGTLLKPLVKFLIDEHGYSCLEFEDLLRQVYVDVARNMEGKVSKSEVSVKTGLSRKEVTGRWDRSLGDNETKSRKYNRAVRVMTGWMRDPEYQKDGAHLRDIAIEGEGPSLEDLVNRYGGDATLKSLLDELLRSGCVEEKEGGLVTWLGEGYVTGTDRAEGWHVLGTDVSLLLETITFNLISELEERRFQKKVSYLDVPEAQMEDIRKGMRKDAQALLEKWDRELNRHWKNKKQDEPTQQVGLGIHYFEKETPK